MEKRKKLVLRRLARVFLVLLMLFIGMVLFIRSPWGQNIIVSKIEAYVSDKTHTKVEIDRLSFTFSGNLFLEGLYLEDKKGDTLIYSRALEAKLPLAPLLFGNKIDLKTLHWEGLRANISRDEISEKFNFDFLIEALVPQDTVVTNAPTETLQINVGVLDFQDFKINYNDQLLGIESQIRFGKLFVEADVTDLETFRFELDNLELSESDITYKQTKSFVVKDTTTGLLPYLAFKDLNLKNIRIDYNSVPDSIMVKATVGALELKLPKANLKERDIEIELLSLTNSTIFLAVPRGNSQIDNTLGNSSFEWPDYLIGADKIVIEKNAIDYHVGKGNYVSGSFNPEDVSLENLSLALSDLKYRPESAQLKMKSFSFVEKSGFQLRNLVFYAKLGKTSAFLSEMNIQTNSSFVAGNLTLQYQSFQKLIDSPEGTAIVLQLPRLELNLRDAFYFQPELAKNEYLKKASQHPFSGKFNAKGTVDAIQINDTQLDWGKTTEIILQGRLGHLTQVDSLTFDFDGISVSSVREDVLKFVSEEDLGVKLPQTFLINTKAKGNLNNIDAIVSLQMPEGNVQLTGNYKNRGEIKFDGILKVDSLRLDKLLTNEQLGGISFMMDISGSGSELNNLNTEIKSDFTQLQFKEYDFSSLELQGKIVNGKGAVDLEFKDRNLNFTARTGITLDSIASKIGLDLNVIGVDLYALGATKEQMKAGLRFKADFEGNLEDYSVAAKIHEGIVVYDNEQYQMGNITLTTHIDRVSTALDIDSDFLMLRLKSNASPQGLNSSLTRQFKGYFDEDFLMTTSTDTVRLNINLKIQPNPILTNVLFRDVEKLDSITLRADFDASTKKLNAELHIPSAQYAGSSVDSLNVLVTGTENDLTFSAGLAAFNADPIRIKKTFFDGTLKNKELLLDFTSYDEENKIVHIASEMTLSRDTTRLHINPTDLIFNAQDWNIPQDNQVMIASNYLGFKNVKLTRNAQEMTVNNTMPGAKEEHIGIAFDNFKLQTILSLLNPDEALASGTIKGDLIIENPFGATGILADFKINALEVMQNAMGNLSLDAKSTGRSSYDFNLSLKDGGADLDLTGDYAAAESGANLNLNLDLNRIDLLLIQAFTDGAIKDASGAISGNIKVSGTPTAPQYQGLLNFENAEFNVATLNSVFKISEETLKIDTKGLYLDTFEIADSDGSKFTLDGSILTEELTNPTFDLKLAADRFRILNSTKEDNELFYGIASMDAEVTVSGDLALPRIEGRMRIREITDVTYITPESQFDVEERDGVVIFVNREDPDAILTRNEQEVTPNALRGYDVKAILEIAKDAEFKVIIDERTGDNLAVSGDAELNLNIEPNGRINLSGRYELNSGHYETSLYNLVKRRFEINPGSTITWQGDPTDAKLDVTAVYRVEASASPLMSTVTSGQDISVTGKYRQVLPFLVFLNVDGVLLEPKISFGLDMPENEQGSIGGTVYSRVQQLNLQEEELNKQVFSLLALNRFYPDSGSDGSTGGTAAIARDNVNRVLSGELNAYSDKVFGNAGFEVDFDLDSFTDYQGDSPQDRTQLNINAKKKLFDDRLIVTAGSAVDVEGSAQPGQEQTPIIGNVSLEYLLTKNGQFRLRGFRKSEYQNIIDGQLIVTGLALIFNREFNRFSQLFNPIKKVEDEKSEPIKEDKIEDQ